MESEKGTNKTFDCLKFKRERQAQMLAEYETRKDEFASFGAFVNAKMEELPWAKRMWQRLAGEAPSK